MEPLLVQFRGLVHIQTTCLGTQDSCLQSQAEKRSILLREQNRLLVCRKKLKRSLRKSKDENQRRVRVGLRRGCLGHLVLLCTPSFLLRRMAQHRELRVLSIVPQHNPWDRLRHLVFLGRQNGHDERHAYWKGSLQASPSS